MTEDYLKVIFHDELESLCSHDDDMERNKLDGGEEQEEVKDCPLCTEAWKCLEKFLQFFDGTNLKVNVSGTTKPRFLPYIKTSDCQDPLRLYREKFTLLK